MEVSIKDPGLESEWAKRRKRDVVELFSAQAPKYDLHDDIIGLGIHRFWARRLQKEVSRFMAGRKSAKMLDLACGTGFITFRIAREHGNIDIDGFDITPEMVDVAKARKEKDFKKRNINFWVGDSEIPYGENKYDIITTCFAFRNFANKSLATENVFKALKPGGIFIIQDMTKPEKGLFKKLYLFALKNMLPVVSWVLGIAKSSPGYLYNTVMLMPKNEDIKLLLESKGFKNVYFKSLSLGMGCIIAGRKAG